MIKRVSAAVQFNAKTVEQGKKSGHRAVKVANRLEVSHNGVFLAVGQSEER